MIETQLRNLIVPTSSHIPEIGSRLYIGGFPDVVTYPAAVMYSISRFGRVHGTDVNAERIQISCYADYLSSATTVAEAILSKVERYKGRESTTDTYSIINSVFDNMSFLYDDGVLKYVRILDVIVRYMTA